MEDALQGIVETSIRHLGNRGRDRHHLIVRLRRFERRRVLRLHPVDLRLSGIESARRLELGDVGVAVPTVMLRPERAGVGILQMVALNIAREIAEQLAVPVGLEPLLQRLGLGPAGAVDDHYPVGLVIVDERRRQAADDQRQRDDQKRQPEAAHAGNLAELASGDDLDVVHWTVSGWPTMWTKTS